MAFTIFEVTNAIDTQPKTDQPEVYLSIND